VLLSYCSLSDCYPESELGCYILSTATMKLNALKRGRKPLNRSAMPAKDVTARNGRELFIVMFAHMVQCVLWQNNALKMSIVATYCSCV
jgi:hypothetical protein